MPLFTFTCQKCSHSFEVLQHSTSLPTTSCPVCGSTKVQKQLGVFAVGSAQQSSVGDCSSCKIPGMGTKDSPCASGGCPFA